ncbi:NAD(P)-binding domain-containing protein [Streptomyces virginiae]
MRWWAWLWWRSSSCTARPTRPNRPSPPHDTAHVVSYLTDHEKRYGLTVRRGVWVEAVHRDGTFLRVRTDCDDWQARAVISATGTWTRPSCRPYPAAGASQAARSTPSSTAAPPISPAGA